MREGATVETHDNTKGLVRAFDVRTGKKLWQFDTIPRPGQFGNDTWQNESWATNGNVGVWTQITRGRGARPRLSARSKRRRRTTTAAIARATTCSPRAWSASISRPASASGTSSSCITRSGTSTCRRRRSLADVTVDGKPRKVVAVPSKQSWLYVFDRVTGEPIWPIEEKPVPDGDVPGEWYAPTQPHPPDKLRYARNMLRVPDDLIDFTPELRAEALERLKRYKYEPTVFMPPIARQRRGPARRDRRRHGDELARRRLRSRAAHRRSRRPATRRARDRSSRRRTEFSDITYVSGMAGQPFRAVLGPGDCCAADSPRTAERAREAAGAASASRRRRAPRRPPRRQGLTVQGLPIVKPPYGLLAAINLDRGELMWQTPHGDTPDNIRNHPAARGMNIPKTGQAEHVRRRPARDQDAGDHGRSAGDDDARASARRDAACLRQEDRSAGRRRVDARAAERIADDLQPSTAGSTSSSRSAAATYWRVSRVRPARGVDDRAVEGTPRPPCMGA